MRESTVTQECNCAEGWIINTSLGPSCFCGWVRHQCCSTRRQVGRSTQERQTTNPHLYRNPATKDQHFVQGSSRGDENVHTFLHHLHGHFPHRLHRQRREHIRHHGTKQQTSEDVLVSGNTSLGDPNNATQSLSCAGILLCRNEAAVHEPTSASRDDHVSPRAGFHRQATSCRWRGTRTPNMNRTVCGSSLASPLLSWSRRRGAHQHRHRVHQNRLEQRKLLRVKTGAAYDTADAAYDTADAAHDTADARRTSTGAGAMCCMTCESATLETANAGWTYSTTGAGAA